MSDDRAKVGDDTRKSEKSGLSPAQVVAAALAAVVAAFLCSTLGVYGTVVGAGLLSVVTTVGSELFMRSLERTKKAARMMTGRRGRGARHGAEMDPDRTVYLPAPTQQQLDEYLAAMERTRVLASSGAVENARARRQWWRRRGPVLAATSALAFVICMLVVTGYEGVTGKALSGDGSTTVSSIVRGNDGIGGDHRAPRGGDAEDVRQRDEEDTSVTPTSEPDAEPGLERDGEEPRNETAPTEESEVSETPETTRPDESTSVSEQPTEPAQPTQSEELDEDREPSRE
ncbi:hypothetical protein [Saccharomonospora glauca]|jgi:hypothetical protein|uniref:Uncharacterized protein n=1 Tax=Saccharomonospora glauca K62 TaxID=928724 RepID=I1D6W5_9PSEU|nr:hypothetical protein [Saccharomonospora glauca]EIF00690.1 hypothetical protein SacglDRAFT_03844 [Saccharomonospora glauca K62]